jgi:Family of unknown function (DUF6311)
MQTRSNIYFLLLAFLLVVEIGFFTFWRSAFDPHTLPVLFLGIQLVIGILPLFLSKKTGISVENTFLSLKLVRVIPLSILAILGIVLAFNSLNSIYTSIPIKVSDSDIIPQLQRFCTLFLAGKFPYTPFQDFGYPMTPTYLPSQWLPFLPAAIFKFDYRYIVFAFFAMAYTVFSIKTIKKGLNIFRSLALLGLPILLIWAIDEWDNSIPSVSVEMLIMSYYLLFALSLTTNSRTFQVIMVVLCLMSRFSFIFWLPLYAFMMWTKEGWRPVLKLGLWVFAGCALLYGPFLWHDPLIFSHAQTYYDLASVGEWTRSDRPPHLYNGLGFAIYIFEKGGDAATLIALLKKYFFIITPSVSVLLGLVWWRFKDKIDMPLFALCSLKISLAVFYSLIQIPYSYLYVTPIILSLAVLYRVAFLLKTKEEKFPVETNDFIETALSNLGVTLSKYSRYAILALSFIFFLLKFDLSALDFTHTNWVYRLSFDPGSELIAFNNFRHTPWSFPIIGRLEGGDYPTVTGIGMTQSVALLAVLFKTISAWLPNDFQYFGWWYLLCFLLQGWFGLKLVRNISTVNCQLSTVNSLLATVFFIIAPPFLFRSGHIVLFSHFFILAALSLYFSSALPQRKFMYSLFLMVAAAGVSQYMAAMTLSILGMSFIDMAWRKIMPVYKVFLYGFSCLAVAFLLFYMMGATLIPSDNYQTYGFGVFSSNLNTFFNPLGNSAILPDLPLSNYAQYEGFGYMGLGFLLLAILVMGYSLLKNNLQQVSKSQVVVPQLTQQSPKLSPLIFVMFLFFIFALSCKIGWNDKVIHEWRYGPIGAAIFETLRGSGRFIWIPFYGIMTLVFIGFFKMKLSNTWKTGILSLFLMLQVLDTHKLMRLDRSIFERCIGEECPHYKWRQLFREASRVIVFPPYSWDFIKTNDFYPFCRAASEEGKAINTGYFARRHSVLVKDYENKLYADWASGTLGDNDKAIYIGKKEKLWRFQKLVSSGQLLSFEYEGYAILVPPVLKNTLAYMAQLPTCRPLSFVGENVAGFLEKNAKNTVFITVSEEATYKLDDQTRAVFQKTGSSAFAKLTYAGSYMGIVHKGKMVFEQVAGQGENIDHTWQVGEILRGSTETFKIDKKIQLTSCGDVGHKMSKTLIDGKEYSPYQRGLNFVVVNDKFEVIETTYFDTYEETSHATFK